MFPLIVSINGTSYAFGFLRMLKTTPYYNKKKFLVSLDIQIEGSF